MEARAHGGRPRLVARDSYHKVMEAAPDVVCLEPFHLALASTSTITAAVYLVITLRLIRVGGNLASVEFNPKSYVRQNAVAANCRIVKSGRSV